MKRLDNEVQIKEALKRGLQKWYAKRPEIDLDKLVNTEYRELDDVLYMTIGEYGATLHKNNGFTSGLWESTKEAVKLAGIPTIDSSKATLIGKSIMINCSKLADYERNRDKLEENRVKFINFAEIEKPTQLDMVGLW